MKVIKDIFKQKLRDFITSRFFKQEENNPENNRNVETNGKNKYVGNINE